VDIQKLKFCKRNIVTKRIDIGAWYLCFEFINFLSVATNCYLLCLFTPRLEFILPYFLDHLTESDMGRLVIMALFEHILLGLKVLLMGLIPDCPADIQREKNSLKTKAKENLYDDRIKLFLSRQKTDPDISDANRQFMATQQFQLHEQNNSEGLSSSSLKFYGNEYSDGREDNRYSGNAFVAQTCSPLRADRHSEIGPARNVFDGIIIDEDRVPVPYDRAIDGSIGNGSRQHRFHSSVVAASPSNDEDKEELLGMQQQSQSNNSVNVPNTEVDDEKTNLGIRKRKRIKETAAKAKLIAAKKKGKV